MRGSGNYGSLTYRPLHERSGSIRELGVASLINSSMGSRGNSPVNQSQIQIFQPKSKWAMDNVRSQASRPLPGPSMPMNGSMWFSQEFRRSNVDGPLEPKHFEAASWRAPASPNVTSRMLPFTPGIGAVSRPLKPAMRERRAQTMFMPEKSKVTFSPMVHHSTRLPQVWSVDGSSGQSSSALGSGRMVYVANQSHSADTPAGSSSTPYKVSMAEFPAVPPNIVRSGLQHGSPEGEMLSQNRLRHQRGSIYGRWSPLLQLGGTPTGISQRTPAYTHAVSDSFVGGGGTPAAPHMKVDRSTDAGQSIAYGRSKSEGVKRVGSDVEEVRPYVSRHRDDELRMRQTVGAELRRMKSVLSKQSPVKHSTSEMQRMKFLGDVRQERSSVVAGAPSRGGSIIRSSSVPALTVDRQDAATQTTSRRRSRSAGRPMYNDATERRLKRLSRLPVGCHVCRTVLRNSLHLAYHKAVTNQHSSGYLCSHGAAPPFAIAPTPRGNGDYPYGKAGQHSSLCRNGKPVSSFGDCVLDSLDSSPLREFLYRSGAPPNNFYDSLSQARYVSTPCYAHKLHRVCV